MHACQAPSSQGRLAIAGVLEGVWAYAEQVTEEASSLKTKLRRFVACQGAEEEPPALHTFRLVGDIIKHQNQLVPAMENLHHAFESLQAFEMEPEDKAIADGYFGAAQEQFDDAIQPAETIADMVSFAEQLMAGWHLDYGMDGLPSTADRCQEAFLAQQWVHDALLILDPSAADNETLDAAEEEYERLADQYRSEVLHRWMRASPGVAFQRSLKTFETGLTEKQEEAASMIPRVWVDYEQAGDEEGSEESWGPNAAGILMDHSDYSGVSPPSPPPLSAIAAMQDMCCRWCDLVY